MQVIVTPKAQKQYEDLPIQEQKKIKKKLQSLITDPYAGKKLAGELAELRSIRVWPYRIIYFINEQNKELFVTNIQHRQGVYKR